MKLNGGKCSGSVGSDWFPPIAAFFFSFFCVKFKTKIKSICYYSLYDVLLTYSSLLSLSLPAKSSSCHHGPFRGSFEPVLSA